MSNNRFFDIECSLVPNENGEKIHKPIIYSQMIIDTENCEILDITVYRGENCINHYLENLIKFWSRYLEVKKIEKYPIDSSPEQLRKFEKAKKCGICNILHR